MDTESQRRDDKAALPVVGIGGSAGGLGAFTRLFDALPADTGAAFVVVQHLSSNQATQLHEILRRHTRMPVSLARADTPLEPDHVYVAAPGREFRLAGGSLRLADSQDARPPTIIDRFFRSMAEAAEHLAVGIVLSGMGSDGTVGIKAVKSGGGCALVQDPDTAEFDSMPRSAAAGTVTDGVAEVEDLARILQNHLRSLQDGERQSGPGELDDGRVEPIFELLQAHNGRNFEGYKRSMVSRRIQRRMSLLGLSELDDYTERLRGDGEELDRLYSDLLISVTDFFRDPEAYRALERTAIPKLPAWHSKESQVRAWIPACATGEEAYSIAMLLHEAMGQRHHQGRLQVFASDIDGRALEVGRNGVYPEGSAADIGPERVQRFMTQTDHQYKVNNALRERIIFADHDLLRDPPYSRLDLISCRNLLIYLQPRLQQRALTVFHYALAEGGLLFLGNTESVGEARELFEPVDSSHRIYRRVAGAARKSLDFFPVSARVRELSPDWQHGRGTGARRAGDAGKAARQLLLREYLPASVVINRKGEILSSFGRTRHFLSLPTGTSNLNVADMVHEGLRDKVRVAMHQAVRTERTAQVSTRLTRPDGDGLQRVRITARPLGERENLRGLLLMVFEELADAVQSPDERDAEDVGEETLARTLRDTQDELAETIRALESSNEELQGSNEEIMSMNEELQSSNEELETSKEELQSANEELTTVNRELYGKIGELDRANNDLANLFAGMRIPILFLDRELRIMRFTPGMKELLNLLSSDIGRPLRDFQLKFDDSGLLEAAGAVLDDLKAREHEVESEQGRSYLRRIQPYRTREDRIQGVVVSFTDVSDLRRSMRENEEAAQRARLLTDALPMAVAFVDMDLRVTFCNRRFKDWFAGEGNSPEGIAVLPLLSNGHDAPIEMFFDKAREGETVTFDHTCKGAGENTRRLQVSLLPHEPDGDDVQGFYLLAGDTTERSREREELLKRHTEFALANRTVSMAELAATLAHQLNQPLGAISSYSNVLKRLMNKPGETGHVVELADKLHEQTRIAADVVKELRAFIDRRTVDETAVDFNQIVRRSRYMVGSRAQNAGATVRLDLAADLPPVFGSPVQLEQLLVNLLVNALEAVEDCDVREVEVATSFTGGFIEVRVSDTGAGIAPDQLRLIFDAFHTTKADGMGMGLAISANIAESHGGRVWATQEENRGSAFHLRLPVFRK